MRVPRATYRLQLHAGFGFDDAAAVLPYLAKLGISHVYLSPILQAAPGSMHGYDVVDHGRVNRELGGEAGFERFCAAATAAGLGQVIDIVPNHMAVGGDENRWWRDVLEHGHASRFAAYFDVDWDPPEHKLRNRVLLPILGDHYGRVLDAGEIRFAHDAGTFTIDYFDHHLPVAPGSLAPVLDAAYRWAPQFPELGFCANAAANLPKPTTTDWDQLADRHRDAAVLGSLLHRLCHEHPEAAAAIDRAVEAINADRGQLHELLDTQNFRLARWRVGSEELGYRRFFDIDTLAGLRVEDPWVFDAVHTLALRWVTEGLVDGLRIDHPDGLRDPEGYFAHLRAAAPQAWIVVEKILVGGEQLRASWPVEGTTGYDFLNDVAALFVDPAGELSLTALWTEFTGRNADVHAVELDAKREIVTTVLAAELNRLTNLFTEFCESRTWYRDFTRHELHDCLVEVLVSFPVYRTYVGAPGGGIDSADIAVIDEALTAASRRSALDPELFQLVRRILTADVELAGTDADELRARFQQMTGPVMAKGVEDTAFYRYLRLSSLCEVGADLSRFGDADAAAFHRRCLWAQAEWPEAMLALSTHDTKRSEDVRVRLGSLSELPEEWPMAVRRWHAMTSHHRVDDRWPDPETEMLLYQTLVGAHPISADRMTAYVAKATKEAKRHTSWVDPDERYDVAVERFTRAVMSDTAFMADVESFVASIADAARLSSLSQKLIALTAPGVPDLYQGSEMCDLSLVDPDNRRPVDFERRRLLLDELVDGKRPGVAVDDSAKLWVVRCALAVRSSHEHCFGTESSYQPVEANGAAAAHVVAFSRHGEVVTVASRLLLSLGRAGGWRDTTIELPVGRWRDVITDATFSGGAVRLADLLMPFPVALLVAEQA